MVKTLVVPLDGSPVSESALEPAVRLADAFDAQIHLLSSTVGALVDTKVDYLKDVATRVAGFDENDGGGPVRPRDVTSSTAHFVWPAPAIIEALGAAPESALCMSTHGRGGFGRLMLGSVADEVVGGTDAPVVLVGPECKLTDLAGRRLVLCWEGIEIEPDLLATATAWARSLALDVTVLHVRRPKVDDRVAPFAEWQDARRRVADTLVAAGLRAGALIVEGHDVAGEIVGYARTTPTALLAMGCRPHRPQHQGPLGNVVLRTAKHAPCPILVQSPVRTV